MKKFLLPLLFVGLVASCAPTTNPSTEPSIDPSEDGTSESIESIDPTETTSESETTSDENTSVGGNYDITIEVPDDLGVDVVNLADAKKFDSNEFLYAFGVVAQFTYGYGDDGIEKVGFYLVDNTSSMYVYAGAGNIKNVEIGYTVLVNGSIKHFISQQEAGAGAEIGYKGAQQISADVIEVIEAKYHELPDTGIETKTIKELSTTNFRSNDISGTIFKTRATITHTTVSGTEVYYFNDLSMDYSLYTYSTVAGGEFKWLESYVGKTYECLIAVHSLRSRDEAWRIIPIDFYYEVEASDEDVANYALDRLEKQFTPTYNSSVEITLASHDEKLGADYEVTYTSSNAAHTITKNDDGSYTLSIDSSVLGVFDVVISINYKGVKYDRTVSIEVIEKVTFDGITLAELQNTADDTVVKVKGYLMRSAANVQGVYICDETAVGVVYYTGEFNYDDYIIGEEIIFEGTVKTDFDEEAQNYAGYKRLSNATVISHDSVAHEWNRNLVDGEKTVEEMYGGLSTANIGHLYKVEGKVVNFKTDHFSNKRFYDLSESSYLTLYCGNQSQIAWLDDYLDKAVYAYIFVRDIKANGTLRFEILAVDVIE